MFKTKLFQRIQKLSATDLLALFAIFFVAATVYFFFSRKTEYLNVTIRLFDHDSPEYSVDSNAPKSWYVEHIIPGKAQKTQFGMTLVEITDVFSYPNGYVYKDVYVTLKVKTIQNKITKQYIYEGSPLLVHDIRSFKVQDLLLTGEITDLTLKKHETKHFHIVMELKPKTKDFINNSQSIVKGIENYVADTIKEGMTIKDSKDVDLVKVMKVEKKPGLRIIPSESGIKAYVDPNFTQVFISIDLLGEKIGNHYYYRKKESLLVGDNLWLTFDNVSIEGTIVSIE